MVSTEFLEHGLAMQHQSLYIIVENFCELILKGTQNKAFAYFIVT